MEVLGGSINLSTRPPTHLLTHLSHPPTLPTHLFTHLSHPPRHGVSRVSGVSWRERVAWRRFPVTCEAGTPPSTQPRGPGIVPVHRFPVFLAFRFRTPEKKSLLWKTFWRDSGGILECRCLPHGPCHIPRPPNGVAPWKVSMFFSFERFLTVWKGFERFLTVWKGFERLHGAILHTTVPPPYLETQKGFRFVCMPFTGLRQLLVRPRTHNTTPFSARLGVGGSSCGTPPAAFSPHSY